MSYIPNGHYSVTAVLLWAIFSPGWMYMAFNREDSFLRCFHFIGLSVLVLGCTSNQLQIKRIKYAESINEACFSAIAQTTYNAYQGDTSNAISLLSTLLCFVSGGWAFGHYFAGNVHLFSYVKVF